MIAPVVIGVLGVLWLAARGKSAGAGTSEGTALKITASSAGLPVLTKTTARHPVQLPPAKHGETVTESQARALETARAIARAIASGDASRMRALANELDGAGGPEAAAELRAAAAEIDRMKVAAARVATTAATTTQRLPAEPVERVVAAKLTKHLWPGPLSGVRRYSEDRDLVAQFQTLTGSKPDGMYGVGTGIAVANLGIVPARPFYFSRDPARARAQKALWTRSMVTHAATDPQRAALWRAASEVQAL